jgi:hypothetical protein
MTELAAELISETEAAAEPVSTTRRPISPGLALTVAVVVAVLLFVATAFVVAVTYSPFIYFRF